jgi:hypothetical protein
VIVNGRSGRAKLNNSWSHCATAPLARRKTTATTGAGNASHSPEQEPVPIAQMLSARSRLPSVATDLGQFWDSADVILRDIK